MIGHASLNMPVATEIDVSNTTQQTSEEEKENDRKLMEQWTRMFFSMGRIPQQGEQILIFPGLFSKTFLIQSFTTKLSNILHYCRWFNDSGSGQTARITQYRSGSDH